MIDRIEVFITELPVRLQRTFSSGSYDTGPPKELLGKPVFVKIYANGVVGCAQIRPISPGHFVADTVHSVVAAITEVYGPNLIGRDIFDIEAITEMFDLRLAANPAARAVLDIALHDAMGKALGMPIHKLIGGACQPVIPLEWSVSLADDVNVMIAEARRAVDRVRDQGGLPQSCGQGRLASRRYQFRGGSARGRRWRRIWASIPIPAGPCRYHQCDQWDGADGTGLS